MSSFNVQNAKSLEITEGEVKIIQDSVGKQLWGKLNYTTKYAGDTEQQTYSGKNVMPLATADIDNDNRFYRFTPNFPAGTYTISFDLESFAMGTNESFPLTLRLYNGSTTIYNSAFITITPETTLGRKQATFTISSAADGSNSNINETTTDYNNGARAKISNIQIESGSTPTAYEPYVGGIPSPNPDYPQPISVVTGTQTLTITDAGGNTENFTVSLGSTELCKIGSYKDYIYKDGTDWKVHKEIGKQTYDGSEAWNKLNYCFQTTTPADKGPAFTCLSDYFTYNSMSTSITSNLPNGQFGFTTSKVPTFRYDSVSTADDFKDWLTHNPTSIYYHVETATDTTITDTTLIAQLEAVDTWMERCGYTATVSGTLPIIITQTEIV